MKIYPAILSSDLEVVQAQLDALQPVKTIETVQIDLIDGLFHHNLTISPQALLDLNFGRLKLDLHLMVDEPLETVLLLLDSAKFLPVRAVVAQLEHMSFQKDFAKQLKKTSWKAGLSLDLYTPLSAIDIESFKNFKVFQLMGVEAGEQGQKFSESVLNKIKNLKTLLTEHESKSSEIIVDGGVNLDNASKIIQAGAESLVMGSVLWKAEKDGQLKERVDQFLAL